MSRHDRDVVWEELERLFGPVTNDANRARRNRCVKLIKQSILALAEQGRLPRDDAEVCDEIRGRYSKLTQLWPNLPPTDIWLANRWDACDPKAHTPAPGANGPVRIDEPPAPREVALAYLEQLRKL